MANYKWQFWVEADVPVWTDVPLPSCQVTPTYKDDTIRNKNWAVICTRCKRGCGRRTLLVKSYKDWDRERIVQS